MTNHLEKASSETSPTSWKISDLATRHLQHSLNLINNRGWCLLYQARKAGNNHRVSEYSDKAASFSLLGAHNNGVFCLMREEWRYRRLIENQAAYYLGKALKELPDLEGKEIYETRTEYLQRNDWMQAWNDHPARTKQQVKALFEMAILLAKQDSQKG